MSKVRIGIVGVGLIGQTHLSNYAKIQDAEVVAVCDINEQAAQAVASQFGIPDVYTDFRELLKRDDIDAIDVCLHNNFHAPVTNEALKAGKHVYCEKPIAGTYFDGVTMLETAKETGKMLHIQLNTLYKKETKAAKALIEEGSLGKLYHARSTGFRRRGRPFVDGYGTKFFNRKETAAGGALLDMGVYHIAQILYLLGVPTLKSVSGKVYQEMDMDASRREESQFDVEELGLGFVRFEEGVTLDLIEAWSVHMGGFEGSSVLGSKGGVRLPSYSSISQTSALTFHTTVADMDLDSTINLDDMDLRWGRLKPDYDAYASSQQHWIAAIQGRVPLLPTAEIALQTMLISEGVYLSDQLGREVTAEEIIAHSQSTNVLV
ncbi:gfo/Idh/MocA family oxidoreductase [Paenibacillus pinisoli]|uniref:Gfo/Idh/MocA family oxidoreductase n=1 Tax=Paenibacillus pinisoli TaxID=1276110 RepID=A0A3A6PBG8_9BACL|nr:Gfo/Idh/MocA family oxidoreductase [Paenibacillus pinisoli]RJX37180.1 gfo/Idh/MocA family oxidoreductase [Paenibacillus pinisoli]